MIGAEDERHRVNQKDAWFALGLLKGGRTRLGGGGRRYFSLEQFLGGWRFLLWSQQEILTAAGFHSICMQSLYGQPRGRPTLFATGAPAIPVLDCWGGSERVGIFIRYTCNPRTNRTGISPAPHAHTPPAPARGRQRRTPASAAWIWADENSLAARPPRGTQIRDR